VLIYGLQKGLLLYCFTTLRQLRRLLVTIGHDRMIVDNKLKIKGKVHPGTGHEGPEGE
jgi:hypothetical protein